MKRLAFDTNVILYALADFRDSHKTQIARGILDSIDTTQPLPLLSTRVLNEFSSVVTRRSSISQADLQMTMRLLLRMEIVQVSESIIVAAIDRTYSDRLNFYDALIVEAALTGGADILYAEDLSHGQRFGQLRVVNPFLPKT